MHRKVNLRRHAQKGSFHLPWWIAANSAFRSCNEASVSKHLPRRDRDWQQTSLFFKISFEQSDPESCLQTRRPLFQFGCPLKKVTARLQAWGPRRLQFDPRRVRGARRGVRDERDARCMSYRRAIWQTTQDCVGNNSLINEYTLLVAGTKSHLVRVLSLKKAAKAGWGISTPELWMLQQSITIGSILHARCVFVINHSAPFPSPAVNIFSFSECYSLCITSNVQLLTLVSVVSIFIQLIFSFSNTHQASTLFASYLPGIFPSISVCFSL